MLRTDTTTLYELTARGQHPAAGSLERRAPEYEHGREHAGHARLRVRLHHERGGRAHRRREQPGGPAHLLVPRGHQQGAGRPLSTCPPRSTRTAAALAEAVALIDQSNRRTEGALGEYRARRSRPWWRSLDLSAPGDIEQRLKRFSGLLDGDRSRPPPAARARSPASSRNRAPTAARVEQERGRASSCCRASTPSLPARRSDMFSQTTQRFTETVQGMKQMAAEMQRELETTRAPSCAAACSSCRRRPPRAPRRCAA